MGCGAGLGTSILQRLCFGQLRSYFNDWATLLMKHLTEGERATGKGQAECNECYPKLHESKPSGPVFIRTTSPPHRPIYDGYAYCRENQEHQGK